MEPDDAEPTVPVWNDLPDVAIPESHNTLRQDRARPGEIHYRKLPLGGATRLESLTAEFAFFTPVILSAYGGFRDGPFADFVASYQPIAFYLHVFDSRLFRNVTTPQDPIGGRALLAIERPHREAFVNYMLSLMFLDAQRTYANSVGLQELSIPDPLLRDRNRPRELRDVVTIDAFGINGSRGIVAFDPVLRDDCLIAKKYPPERTMQDYLERVVAGEDPHELARRFRPSRPGSDTLLI